MSALIVKVNSEFPPIESTATKENSFVFMDKTDSMLVLMNANQVLGFT